MMQSFLRPLQTWLWAFRGPLGLVRRFMVIVRRPLLLTVSVLLGYICNTIAMAEMINFLFPFFIFLCLIISWVALADFNLQPSRRSIWLFFPPFVFAFLTALTAPAVGAPLPLKYVLSLSFTILYMGLLTMTYRGGRLAEYSLFDYLRNFSQLALSLALRPLMFFRQWWRDFMAGASANASAASAPWGRAIAILTFLALFVLFWWVDLLFRELPRVIWNFISSSGGGLKLPGILLWSYLILGMLLHAATQSRDLTLTVDNPGLYFRRWFSYNRSAIIYLVMLLMLFTFTMLRMFGIFNWDNYISDAQMYPAPMEMRFGFWALLLTAVLPFMVVGWLNHVTVFDNMFDRWVHVILNLFVFSNVCVILLTAWQSVSRVTFGIRATRHVWYARMGLVWLAVMFLLFIVYEARARERDYPFAALIVTTLMVFGFVILALFLGSLL